MSDIQDRLEIFDAIAERRNERRRFLRFAGGAAAGVGGLALLSACNDDNDPTPSPTPTPTPTPSSTSAQLDIDVLNFALNLEYLEAQFYSWAAFGVGLNPSLTTGVGTTGTVTGGAQVNFSDNVVRQYAREIAQDEAAHVIFLRSALGSAAVAMPNLNISGDANGAFTAAARAAGVVGSTGTFNPYASDENFLLGAFIFEDVGVTAYKGAITSITNKTYIEAAAGIHAAEGYHAGLIRTILYAKGLQTPSLRTAAGQISDARDSLDGSSDLDQGITLPNGTLTTTALATNVTVQASNLVPTDSSGIVFSRTPAQVLNVVYLSAGTGRTSGGFFPNGINGNIRTT
ncbi:hypothetical protein GGQ80_000331 [Sphingomonas jinjuensis]|uniref:Ferritin-like domain-containing protein n=1 Tax=Sphingomonas jinjuensis TaxID=535907 RepID=A0A840FGI6_9SPHN|nr:ferritin-like domain-containing protein [Sphingomonas jinjuensis]MBB4152455.1 hypothetical protein [Sphingomonas jinjuensis]